MAPTLNIVQKIYLRLLKLLNVWSLSIFNYYFILLYLCMNINADRSTFNLEKILVSNTTITLLEKFR